MEICDGLTDKHTVTDGQTDIYGKNNMSPSEGWGGGHIKKGGHFSVCLLKSHKNIKTMSEWL